MIGLITVEALSGDSASIASNPSTLINWIYLHFYVE